MKKEKLLIQNTGLRYEVLSHGLVLCSFPTLRQAMQRSHEIINELGLSHEVVYIGHK
jgi:hypothetical protein